MALPVKTDTEVMLENVRIVFRNFAGEKRQFNDEGKRNFSVVLDPEMADRLEKEGWNVKRKPPREEGDEEFCHLKITVNFASRKPPKIIMMTSRSRTTLVEELAPLMDIAELDNVDLIFRAYDWDVNGNTGRKAYLKTLYATIHEDPLDLKYAEIPDMEEGRLALPVGEGEYAEILEDPNED